MSNRNATVWVAALLAAALVSGGCGPSGVQPPRPVTSVQRVEMLVAPSPVNTDESPGPDAIWAQVFFYQAAQPEPVTVEGTLEIRLYDGRLGPASQPATMPLHTWTFSGEQLEQRIIRWMGLWGYALPLAWGPDKPTGSTATLIARYQLSSGRWLHSAPAPIPIQNK